MYKCPTSLDMQHLSFVLSPCDIACLVEILPDEHHGHGVEFAVAQKRAPKRLHHLPAAELQHAVGRERPAGSVGVIPVLLATDRHLDKPPRVTHFKWILFDWFTIHLTAVHSSSRDFRYGNIITYFQQAWGIISLFPSSGCTWHGVQANISPVNGRAEAAIRVNEESRRAWRPPNSKAANIKSFSTIFSGIRWEYTPLRPSLWRTPSSERYCNPVR